MKCFRPRMLIHLTTAGFAWLLVASGAGTLVAEEQVAPAADDQGGIKVVVAGGMLTLRAQEVPLADVLAAIGERAGFEVSVRGTADMSVSMVLAEIPLEEGLRQLLRGGSFAFFYDRPRAEPAAELVELRVYAFEEGAAQPHPDRAAAPASEQPATLSAPMLHDDEAAPVISPLDPLEDRLEFARIEARAGKPRSRENLITLVLEDEHADVRGLAASALGRLGGPEAGGVLAEALSDRDWRVRGRAAWALGAAWGDQAVAPLTGLLIEERARSVRRVAAYTLSRIQGDAARDALEPLREDRDPAVRRIATLALEAAED
jgi:HEAT repeats